ncbi:hypothetical protein [Acidaminococcus fermentans]|uniref:hypothetical protein n=1 Tax=Acidaminococcus fermentans TaxID=905 RepID=UPI003F890927
MDVSLGDIVAAIGLAAGGLVWIIHSIVAPLNVLLDRTAQSLDRLDKTLNDERARREAIELRLENVDNRAKSNTHRIDQLEDQQKKCLSD